jgi:hypothetical protein
MRLQTHLPDPLPDRPPELASFPRVHHSTGTDVAKRRGMSRRSMIATSGAVASAWVVASLETSPAQAGTVVPPFDVAVTTTSTFDTAHRIRYENTAPIVVTVPAIAALAGASFTLTFDERGFSDTLDDAMLSFGKSTIACPTRRQAGSVTVTLPQEISDAERGGALALPLASVGPLMNDGIGALRPSAMLIETSTGTTRTPVDRPASVELPAPAFRPILSVGWTSIRLTDGEYDLPSVITVLNEGPGALPVGALIAVSYDPEIVRACSLSRVVDPSVPSQGQTALDLELDSSGPGSLSLRLIHDLLPGHSVSAELTFATDLVQGHAPQYAAVSLQLTSEHFARIRPAASMTETSRTSGGLSTTAPRLQGVN